MRTRRIALAFDAIPGAHLWAAVGLTILSYAVMTGCDQSSSSRPAHVPSGIYGVPEMSMVGVTEQELTVKKIPYETGTAHLWETARMNSMELLRAF